MIDYGLTGKVAVVTRVSRHIGIGAAIAHSLAKCDRTTEVNLM
jgi:3-oxoacyl-[acyl-carrier protein] reductase